MNQEILQLANSKLTVEDTTVPTITVPDDIVLEASSLEENIVNLGNADASDLVSISSITNDAPETFGLGETLVTWTAMDSSGNSANATQMITLVDTTSPTIETPEDIQIEATSSDENTISLVAPIASDSVTEVLVTNDAPNLISH